MREHRGDGPAGTRVLRLATNSVFVWTTPWRGADGNRRPAPRCSAFRSTARRRARSRPRAARSTSSRSSKATTAILNVLVRAKRRGDGMWAAETQRGRARACCACRSRASPTAATARRAQRVSRAADAGTGARSRTATSAATCSTARAPAGAGRSRRRSRSSTRCATRAAQPCSEFRSCTASTASKRSAATRSSSAATARTCTSRACASARAPKPRTATRARTRHRARRAATASSTSPQTAEEGLLGLPIIGGGRGGRPAAARGSRRRSCTCATAALSCSELGTLDARAERDQRERRLPGLVRRLVRQLAAAVPRRTACSR